MKLALHACCGPCLLEPLDALSAQHDIVVVYANPNIHPVDEYTRRRDTLLDWTASKGVEVVEVGYDPLAWDAAVAGVEGEPGRRCRRCFELRLGMTAKVGAEMGCDAIATTLSVSPYQDHDTIVEAGEAACTAHRVAFLETDFRDRYREATRRSRELGMYRQNYCGCRYSDAEAAVQRSERAARKTGEPQMRSSSAAATS